jgi:hypothetical protein
VKQGTAAGDDWIKLDLHIHTLDDPKDKIDYTAHQLLERARMLGFHVLTITLHDTVFDRAEVFADAAAMAFHQYIASARTKCGECSARAAKQTYPNY